jgi:hypothetical protein
MSIYTNNSIANSYYVGSTAIENDRFYHVAIVSNGYNWSIYVNGKKEILNVIYGTNSGAWMKDLVNINQFLLGCNKFSFFYDPAYLNGILDEVRLYNRPLSEHEIQLLYYENKK